MNKYFPVHSFPYFILSAIAIIKNGVNRDVLWVCAMMEHNDGFINNGGNMQYPPSSRDLNSSYYYTTTDKTLLPRMIDSVYIAETVSKTRHSDISPETLLSKLRISLDYAQDMLQATTQQGIWQAVRPITRRYRTDVMAPRIIHEEKKHLQAA